MGFGRLGAQIIGENMSGDGELNVMIPGVKIITIFVLCRIHNFMETTDCLQEEIMVFGVTRLMKTMKLLMQQ